MGALYIRKGVKLKPLLLGGGQESGFRPGTEPTAQIAALAAACKVWMEHRDAYTERMTNIKNHFLESAQAAIPELVVVSPGDGADVGRVPKGADTYFYNTENMGQQLGK